ncbi:hypothetical protein PQR05_29675 [Paraburkholderia sediminicola]|uniref:hypothetical protein n=1 Tax=Paraburkholderia sediminicola TaxID=458836 RepID=UPI0038BAEB58
MSHHQETTDAATANDTARQGQRAVNGVKLPQQVVDVTGCMPLEQAALMLGHADILARLARDSVIAENGLPYLQFINAGLFKIGANREVLLTGCGQAWFGQEYPPTPAVLAAMKAGPQ